jgi:hypothetical protein
MVVVYCKKKCIRKKEKWGRRRRGGSIIRT